MFYKLALVLDAAHNVPLRGNFATFSEHNRRRHFYSSSETSMALLPLWEVLYTQKLCTVFQFVARQR